MKTLSRKIFWLLISGCWFVNSCSEVVDSVVPGNGNEAYINFYSAIEAISQSRGEDSLAYNNMIYVNDSVPNEVFRYFPAFSANFGDDRQYPWSVTGISEVSDGSVRSGDIFYLPIMADSYKFIFTSCNRVFLKDTTISLKPKIYTTQYITESPVADDAYTIVTAPVELKGTAGKVRVQIVNLATDWGAIDVWQVDKDNTLVPSALPANLAFGAYSAYAELDVADADSNNNLVLKFRGHGETGAKLSTIVPAISGSAYTLVVQGFIGESVRRIKKSNTEYASIQIFPSLRVNQRRVY